MKIKDQVASLESSKRLKELGVKQESLFTWLWLDDETTDNTDNKWTIVDSGWIQDMGFEDRESFSAFTVAELGEMLPDGHGTWQFRFGKNHRNTGWHGRHIDNGDTFGFFNNTSPTEAEARAKMLIYLLENKLI